MADDRNSGENTGRNKKGQFAEGNPGKPKGVRNRATQAVQGLMDENHEKLTQKAIDMALGGDGPALRLCMDRICPPLKDVPVNFDLPPMEDLNDASEAATAVLSAVSSGSLTPDEGARVMGLVDSFRRTIEASDIERRVKELESKYGNPT